MATQLLSSSSLLNQKIFGNSFEFRFLYMPPSNICLTKQITKPFPIRCSVEPGQTLRTCKYCKTQFDPAVNNPRACRHHTAHFGGETKRKFESVHSGGTLNTPDSGKVLQYWHCCGSEDPFDLGCTAAPHASYDD